MSSASLRRPLRTDPAARGQVGLLPAIRKQHQYTEDDFIAFVNVDTIISAFRADSGVFMGSLTLAKVFPVILLICNASSAVCYAVAGDFRRSLYWAASTICVGVVTF